MPLNEAVRDAISDELTKRGMSRRALARELGWTQTYIQGRLTGRYDLTTSELERIAAALGVPVTQLLPAQERVGDAR